MKALEVFMPKEIAIDSYQLEKVISILEESTLYGPEIDMAISTVDHFRKDLKENYQNKLEVFDMISKAFDIDRLYIPSIFDDEIKVITFLSELKANKTIKLFKQYINTKEKYDEAVETNQTSNKENVIDAALENFYKIREINLINFEAKEKYCEFQEAFANSDAYKELEKYIDETAEEYIKKAKKIDSIADKIIDLIEDDEDAIELLKELKEMK